jgi:hypothetical protein
MVHPKERQPSWCRVKTKLETAPGRFLVIVTALRTCDRYVEYGRIHPGFWTTWDPLKSPPFYHLKRRKEVCSPSFVLLLRPPWLRLLFAGMNKRAMKQIARRQEEVRGLD